MRVRIFEDYEQLSDSAARELLRQVLVKPHSVLGLATGSSPMGLYEKVSDACRRGLVSFARVHTFNLDEYRGVEPENPLSYHYFMQRNLFRHLDVPPSQVHIPDGLTQDPEKYCRNYEKDIMEHGGIDLQLLGIGRNGHIGFNEPGEPFGSGMHLVELHPDTRAANARFFDSPEEVPTQALTMGIKTICRARKIFLLASGVSKAPAIFQTLFGAIREDFPSTVLQLHPDVTLFLDRAAAQELEPVSGSFEV